VDKPGDPPSGRIYFLRSELEQFVRSAPGLTVKDARENATLRANASM
jgi:hypothetical protein